MYVYKLNVMRLQKNSGKYVDSFRDLIVPFICLIDLEAYESY